MAVMVGTENDRVAKQLDLCLLATLLKDVSFASDMEIGCFGYSAIPFEAVEIRSHFGMFYRHGVGGWAGSEASDISRSVPQTYRHRGQNIDKNGLMFQIFIVEGGVCGCLDMFRTPTAHSQ